MKKLLLLSIFIISCYTATSQVYNAGTMFSSYYDIAPDSLMNYTTIPYTNETYDLNVFSDPLSDLQIIAHGAGSSGGADAYIRVRSLNPGVSIRFGRVDSVYAPGSSMWVVTKVAKPLIMGDAINPAGAMWDTLLYLTDHSGHDGGNKDVNDFIGGDKYIGLKYDNGITTSYGWVRVQCISKDSCYVKDYSSTPLNVGISDAALSQASVYPNPVTDHFYLRDLNTNRFDISKLKVSDMYGREIEFSCEIKSGSVRVDIDSNIPEGYYLATYISQDIVFSKKLVKGSK